jgi:hypothetical protein
VAADVHGVLHVLAQADGGSHALVIPTWVRWGLPAACAVAALYLLHAMGAYGGRARALRRLARREGLTYHEADPAGIGRLRFATFAGAEGVDVTNVLTLARPAGSPARAFDYSLWTGRETAGARHDVLDGLADELFGFDPGRSARASRVHTTLRSGALVQIGAFCPRLTITPTTWVTRAFEAIGVADIDFESDEFNRGWDVRCADRRFAALFVDAQLIDLILDLGDRVGVETFGNSVLLTSKLCRPEQLVRLGRAVARIAEIVPPVLAEEYPTVADMEAEGMLDARANRSDGRRGRH